MSSHFAAYLHALGPAGDPPDDAAAGRILDTLRRALVHEMKRRSLWSSPPSYLGACGGARWTDGDLLEDLLLACYLFIFIRRLSGLRDQLLAGKNVDGLVFRNIRNFLTDTQRRHDPLGYRIFGVARSAVKRLLAAAKLHVCGGDPEVGNGTVLAFSPWHDAQATVGADLRQQAAVWTDELMPELITAWSTTKLSELIGERIARLSDEDVEVFRFRDLVEPLKAEARARWYAIRRDGEGETVVEEGSDGMLSIVRLVRPHSELEERQSFEQLLACMEERLERLRAKEKTKQYLHRLWLFIRGWAAEPVPETGEPAADRDDRFPADQKLGERLGIPRHGIPRLKATLGNLLEACGGVAGAHDAAEETPTMDLESRRRRLQNLTAEAAVRHDEHAAVAEGRGGEPPQPGDRFVLDETSALPVQWVVLEEDPENAQRLRVIPWDDHPLAGSHDLAVDDVVRLRCGLAAWLDREVLSRGMRAGVVDPEVLERARRLRAAIVGGTLRASIRAREVDGDPDYRSWLETLAQAQARLTGSAPPGPAPVVSIAGRRRAEKRRSWSDPRFGLALAAGFAAAALGLSVWVGMLHGRLDELDRPALTRGSESPVIRFEDTFRGESLTDLSPDSTHVGVDLFISHVDRYSAYRFELLEREGDEVIWDDVVTTRESGLVLVLPRHLLSAAQYRLRLFGRDEAGNEVLLDEQPLPIELEGR